MEEDQSEWKNQIEKATDLLGGCAETLHFRCKREEYKPASVRKLRLSGRSGVIQQDHDPSRSSGSEQHIRQTYQLHSDLK